MAWQNNLREIRIILYRLKRNFGLSATLCKPKTMTNDVKTGDTTLTYDSYTINRAILMPVSESRTFKYALSYIAANKNFTYGAMFDTKTRTMIIDAHDLPANFAVTTSCHVVFDNRRYNIKTVELAEHDQGWLLDLIEVDSSDAEK